MQAQLSKEHVIDPQRPGDPCFYRFNLDWSATQFISTPFCPTKNTKADEMAILNMLAASAIIKTTPMGM